MGGLFSRPKLPPGFARQKVDPVKAPEATPELIEEDIGGEIKQKAKRKRGRRSTLLTGDLVPQNAVGNKTLLGQ